MKNKTYVLLRKNISTGEIEGWGYRGIFSTDRVMYHSDYKQYGPKMAEKYHQDYLRRQDWLYKSDTTYGLKANSANQYMWFWLRQKMYRFNRIDINYEYKIFRVGSKRCPVELDWSERKKMNNGVIQKIKSKIGTAPFKVTHPEYW